MLSSFAITQRGQSHIDADKPGQDYSLTQKIKLGKKPYIISAVSDGVGSCSYSQYGSETSVKNIMAYLSTNIKKSKKWNKRSLIQLIKDGFENTLEMVEKKAEEMNYPFLQFDCTLTVSIYDGEYVYFGHIGDGGIVALYVDGTYEMITHRHKGEEAHSVYPLRNDDYWEFGVSHSKVASFAMMTDGVLDHCVGGEIFDNRVYWPFLKPALTEVVENESQLESMRTDWEEYFKRDKKEDDSFRKKVTDDISLLVVMNSKALKKVSISPFDWDIWDKKTLEVKKRQDEILYKEFREYKNSEDKKKYQKVIKPDHKTIKEPICNDEFSDNKVLVLNNDEVLNETRKLVSEILKISYKSGGKFGKALKKKMKTAENKQLVMHKNAKYADDISLHYRPIKGGCLCRIIKNEVLQNNDNPNSEYFECIDKMKALCEFNYSDINGCVFPLDYYTNNGQICFIQNDYSFECTLSDIMQGFDRKKIISQYNTLIAMKLAYNLCSMVFMLHKNGIILGDLNPEYFYYTDGKIILINPEVFTFSDSQNNRRFYTNTVYSDIAAPELMNRDMLERRRFYSYESDYFSLAILVFWLLTDGGHPFNCLDMLDDRSSSYLPIDNEFISKGSSYYFGNKKNSFVDNKTKRFEQLPDNVKKLFYKTFSEDSISYIDTGVRATAEEWLRILQSNIKLLEEKR